MGVQKRRSYKQTKLEKIVWEWWLFRPVDRDVFVRGLNRQLRTPSHWLPANSCKKKGQRGALAAVCTPTLKSASKKHQKTVHPRIWAPRVALWRWQKNCVSVCVCCLLFANIFSSHLYVSLKHGQATKEFLLSLPKVPTLFPTSSALFKLPQHLKRLKALLTRT